MSDALDYLRLARTDGVGPITYRRLLNRYKNAAAALDALPGLARAGGRMSGLAVPAKNLMQKEVDRLARMGGQFLFLGSPNYPPLLALLEDAPPVIAVLGDPAVLHLPGVAMVGSRNASTNGQQITGTLAETLAAAGMCIVSGLARGIDTAAHAGAMRTGRTVACVAGGLDIPYPAENASLQARIVTAGGAVVAEAPLGTNPQSRHFPRRNRIIAGLSLGVVVVEAAARSGSLITARLAQEAGREIFAVPGSPLDPRCRGSNDLIRQGAHLVEEAADVMNNLPDHPSRAGIARSPMFARGKPADLLQNEQMAEQRAQWPVEDEPVTAGAGVHLAVLELLSPSPTSVDVLLRRCQLSPATVMSALLDLELAGRVEALPGNRVALLSELGP